MVFHMPLKTLKIKVETHEALTKVKGKLMAETGKEVTYDDAIMWLIKTVEKLKVNGEKHF